MLKPYKAQERSGGAYWIVTDARTGAHVSYPTTKSNARREAATMNAAYKEAIENA